MGEVPRRSPGGPWLCVHRRGLPFTMVTTGLLGAVIERVCLKPLRGISGTAPMITTIGVSLILQSLILYATNFANNVPVPVPHPQ